MRNRELVKKRIVSLILVMLLLLGSITSVQAEDNLQESKVKSETQESLAGQTFTEEETVPKEELPDEAVETVPEKSDNLAVEQAVTTKDSADKQVDSVKKTGMAVTAVLRVDGYGKSVVYPVSVTLPDTYKTFEEYGITGVKDPGYYTLLHLMAQYCVDKGLDPASQIALSGGNLKNFLNAGSGKGTFFMFMVNNTFPEKDGLGYMVTDCPVANGDYAVVYDWYWSGNSVYSYFANESMQVNANELFSVQLKANSGMSSMAADASNAQIVVTDNNGNEITDSNTFSVTGKTDKNGKAELSFFKSGTYLLTAERINGAGNNELNRPYAKIIVDKEAQLTDAQSVSAAKALLNLEGISGITQNMELPAKGRYNTAITWSSSDDKVITATTGKVTRPVDKNPKVTLTAKISKGTETAEKNFEVTVKGKTTELAYLSVSTGNIQFLPETREYTIYVPMKDSQGGAIKELEVTARPNEEAGFFKINGTAFFTSTGNVFKNETKKVPLNEDSTTIKIEVNTGGIWGNTTITVKRGNNIGSPLPELPSVEWGQHLGDKNNNAVVSAKPPLENGTLLWESFSNAPDYWGTVYAGTPILVNGAIYAVQNNKLQALDAKTGKLTKSAALIGKIGYYANITYGGGMIFVPLGDGRIQCFNAATLTSMFVTEKPGGLLGSFTIGGAIHYADGVIYIGVSDYAGNGYYAAYDTVDLDKDDTQETISAKWTSGSGDYYGSCAVTVGNYVIFAGDKGMVSSVDIRNGKEADTCSVGSAVSGAAVYADGAVWVTTKGKKLYKLGVSADGKLSAMASAAMPLGANTSPAVSGGKVYVTGGDFDNGGFLAVYDLNLNKLAEKKLEQQMNTPTVTTGYDDAYVYFTENASPGSLYTAKVTANNKITITRMFTPAHGQYSMSKVLIGADGTVYYSNDAGYIYAVTQGAQIPEKKPDSSKDENKDSGKEALKPSPGPAVSVSRLSEVRRTAKLRAKTQSQEKTSSEEIVSAMSSNADAGKKSITIKNPPEVLEASVFSALAQQPDFRLVLDCGTYTISIKGADVKDVNATLSTKLSEKETELNKEDAEKLGQYQQLELKQEGSFPGVIQIVYRLPEKLTQVKALYLYKEDLSKAAEDVAIQKQYAMFSMAEPGAYILSDTSQTEAMSDSGKTSAVSGETASDNKSAAGFPQWGGIILGAAGGMLIGGVAVGAAARKKRKNTWEKEK